MNSFSSLSLHATYTGYYCIKRKIYEYKRGDRGQGQIEKNADMLQTAVLLCSCVVCSVYVRAGMPRTCACFGKDDLVLSDWCFLSHNSLPVARLAICRYVKQNEAARKPYKSPQVVQLTPIHHINTHTHIHSRMLKKVSIIIFLGEWFDIPCTHRLRWVVPLLYHLISYCLFCFFMHTFASWTIWRN